MTAKDSSPTLSLGRWIFKGAAGFTLVSLSGYSVWAFGGRTLHQFGGDAALYTACAVVFLGLAGLLMSPLIAGPDKIRTFYKTFSPAFLAYAAAWCATWFLMKSRGGEWVASLAGSMVFAAVLGKMLGSTKSFLWVAAFVFATHSAGYFVGAIVYENKKELFSFFDRRGIALAGMLSWGLFHGLGFGAGIGAAYYKFQQDKIVSKPA
jgi:hypothetical protein